MPHPFIHYYRVIPLLAQQLLDFRVLSLATRLSLCLTLTLNTSAEREEWESIDQSAAFLGLFSY